MKQGISVGFILAMAKRGHFITSRYSDRHRTLRKKVKKLAREGKIVLDFEAGGYFYYTAPKGI